MQSLVLDKRHPIALELAGTHERRIFIVRATTQAALTHVEALLRAQYPQSEIHPLREHDDPFQLAAHEEVTAVELIAGGGAYLPLRTWKEEQKDGSDPLLGLLAALGRLPANTRVISQISLLPAASNWSRWNLRRAIENPLEPERQAKERQRMISIFTRDYVSNALILNIGLLVLFLFVARPWIPTWTLKAIIDLLTGQNALVSAAQRSELLALAGVVGGLELVVLLLYWLGRGIFKRRALYDPKVVSQKISRMAYHTRLRLYVIGPKAEKSTDSLLTRLVGEYRQRTLRKDLLLQMVAAYRQFNMANGAFFVPNRLSAGAARRLITDKDKVTVLGGGWQHGLQRSRHMVSVDALASLWHLPSPEVLPELALVEHRRSRTMLIPPAVTQQCVGLPEIGFSEHAGYRRPFALTPEFFTYHTLISGKAGEGKSMFLQYVAREAMKLGGLVMVDPFGYLCEDVLRLVPPERQEDVVFVDLSDPAALIGLNPLDVTLDRGRDKFIADLLKMFSQLWSSNWSAQMENAFEMSLRTLFEANKVLVQQDSIHGPEQQYTLLDVLPLLTNVNFCHVLLQQIQDDYLHRWWREFYEPLSISQQRDVIKPVAAKVAKFESIVARRILGQGVTTINFAQLIEERKIILFKLAKGVVGTEVSSMIGATLLGLIQSTLEEQGRRNNTGSARLSIILDEFQRIAGADYRVLSELRKYGANFFLSTQSLEYLHQFNPLLLPTIQANVRQTVSFNMSSQDAGLISKDLGVDQEDILHLDINSCYVSALAAGRRQPTFSLQLKAPTPEGPEWAESIRTRCRIRYTRPVEVIDEKLREAMLRSVNMVPQSIPPFKPEEQPYEREGFSPAIAERERTHEGSYSEGYREHNPERNPEHNPERNPEHNPERNPEHNPEYNPAYSETYAKRERPYRRQARGKEKVVGVKYDPFAFHDALSEELREELELMENDISDYEAGLINETTSDF
ncbi:hypothetical protein ccbrp13_05560 [Ktedonobacteria bacterium brp13]|nr:hypothetical protein ccbrp13_05560 [Ktedonobacteria bacterium brp13]